MKKILLVVGLFVAGATFVVFAPTLLYDFVPVGDAVNVVHNPYFHPLTLQGAMNYALRPYGNVWSPLTHLSHTIDVAVWNHNPFGHHLTSVVLHSINATLVFWLALNVIVAYKERIRGFVHATPEEATNAAVIAGSVIAALVFALHPLRVESVAWVSARADSVGGFFSLLTTIFYFTRAEAPQRLLGKRWLVVIVYAMALMSSSTAIVLPVVYVLLDRVLLKRTTNESMKEELPLFVLATIRALIAVLFELSFSGSMMNFSWVHTVGVLLHKLFVPHLFSPSASLRVDSGTMLISWALFIAVTALSVYKLKRGNPQWMLAWFSFMVLLVSMFFTSGSERTFVDGFTYIASVGFCMLAGGAVERVLRVGADKIFNARTSGAVVLCCLIGFGLLTWKTLQQQKIWRDGASLPTALQHQHTP